MCGLTVLKQFLLPASCAFVLSAGFSAGGGAEPAPAASEPALRREVLQRARPAIRDLLARTEKETGLQVVFAALPSTNPVVACSIYDTARNEARIQLREGWEDVDVAHELIHLRLDLAEQFAVLAWRRDVPHTDAVDAAFGRVQTYTKDEIVHARLLKLGFKLDGEILRPPLFDDLYVNAARYLEAGNSRPDEGMAHLDRLGYGQLCRAAFLVQAELLLKNYRRELPPRRIAQAERFVRAFRAHRPEEAASADQVLSLFGKYDVQKASGQTEILRNGPLWVGWINLSA
jgi:hypothetical protein